jgi:hypothetical protein
MVPGKAGAPARFIIVEAKGGRGRLGWRHNRLGEPVQQGTPEYLEDVLLNMAANAGSDPALLDALRTITLREVPVSYLLVEVPILRSATGSVFRPGRISSSSDEAHMVRSVGWRPTPQPKLVAMQVASVERILPRTLAANAVTRERLPATLVGCMEALAWMALARRSSRELVRLLAMGSWAGQSYFRVIHADSYPVTLTLYDGSVHRVSRNAAETGSDSPRIVWANTWCVALARRDDEALATLVKSHPRLPGSSGTEHYSHPWLRAQCAFAKAVLAARTNPSTIDLEGTSTALVVALRAADPAAVSPELADAVADIAAREIQMMFAIIDRDEKLFAEGLYEALLAHKKHYAKRNRSRGAMDYIAYGCLALACVAKDWGLRFDVESDYIPRAIIEYGGMPLDQIPESS